MGTSFSVYHTLFAKRLSLQGCKSGTSARTEVTYPHHIDIPPPFRLEVFDKTQPSIFDWDKFQAKEEDDEKEK